jgi:predicted Zn-dependent protease
MQKRKLKLLLVILLGFSLNLAAAPQNLPDMGSSASRTLNKAEERELGEAIMQDVYRHLPVINDPYIQYYIQQLGDWLVSFSPDKGGKYTFFVVGDPTINAFALPGGFIGINSGLFLQTQTESELAAVMAHEIAHVSQRHIARMFEKAEQMSLPTLAAILGSIAVAAAASPALGGGLMAGTLAGSQQMYIDFTRHNEEEADRVGIDILAQAEFDPNGMPDFFGRMGQANRYNDDPSSIPEFLRTHPVSTKRMADAQNRADRYPRPRLRNDAAYHLIKERIRVQTYTPSQIIDLYKANYKKGPAIRYGYALVLAKERSYKDAIMQLDILLKESPDNVLFRMAKADVLIKQEKYEEALAIAYQTQRVYPNNEAILYDLATMYLDAEQPLQAKDVLNNYLKRKRASNPRLYALLARAYRELKQQKPALLAQADYYTEVGNYRGAIQQLQQARTTEPVNEYQTAMIDAKIDDLECELAIQEKMRKLIGR